MGVLDWPHDREVDGVRYWGTVGIAKRMGIIKELMNLWVRSGWLKPTLTTSSGRFGNKPAHYYDEREATKAVLLATLRRFSVAFEDVGRLYDEIERDPARLASKWVAVFVRRSEFKGKAAASRAVWVDPERADEIAAMLKGERIAACDLCVLIGIETAMDMAKTERMERYNGSKPFMSMLLPKRQD